MKKLLFLSKLKSHLSIVRFWKDRSAVAMVEFAMMLPLLILLAAGSFEVARFALIMQKLDRIVATLSDLVARSELEAMTEIEISNVIDSAYYMAKPFDITGNSMIILTSVVGRTSEAPYILSQRVEGSISGQSSALGSAINGDATLPDAFPDTGSGETLANGEALIAAELIYSYSPYLSGNLGFFEDMIFYRNAYFRPRFTATITFPSAP